MPVGFGFSIGDLIAAGKLANEIAVALSDCRGAAAEYQALIDLLLSLKTSIDHISKFISTLSVSASVYVDHAFMNGILFHGGRCHELLTRFQKDSWKYTERLINGTGNKAKVALRKVKWSLYSADDARKLEQRLSSHLQAFDRYLIAINIQASSSSTQLQTQVNQISCTLTQISETICISQRNPPKALGYPWEADDPGSYIHLDDILGRSIVLPALLCRTSQTLKDTIKIMFSDHPGFEDVRKGSFEVMDESSGCTVLAAQDGWKLRPLAPINLIDIKPGSKLSMNILRMEVVELPDSSPIPTVKRQENCPRCGCMTSGRNFRTCLNCNLKFQKTNWEQGVHVYITASRQDLHISETRRYVRDARRCSGNNDYNVHDIAGKEAVPTLRSRIRHTNTGKEDFCLQRIHYITLFSVYHYLLGSDAGCSVRDIIQAIEQGNLQLARDLLIKAERFAEFNGRNGWNLLVPPCVPSVYVLPFGHRKRIVELQLDSETPANHAATLIDTQRCH